MHSVFFQIVGAFSEVFGGNTASFVFEQFPIPLSPPFLRQSQVILYGEKVWFPSDFADGVVHAQLLDELYKFTLSNENMIYPTTVSRRCFGGGN